jgi:ketosteroid isomerase-like protein
VEGEVSAENIDVVRASWAGWNAEGLDGLSVHWAPDIDWRAIEGAPDDVGVMAGRDAVRAYIADWDEMFADLRIDVMEVIDAGGETVVSVQRASGVAKGSGVPAEIVYGVVYTVRDGKIVRGREYATREQAVAAAGVTV